MAYIPPNVTIRLRTTLAYAALLGSTAASSAFAAAPNFGQNVYIFDPSMSDTAIQTTLTSLSNEPQFGIHRYAVLFKPGTYTIDTTVGFYESIAGLGAAPGDVVINGGLRAEAPVTGNGVDNATTVFWRSEENFTVNPTGGATRWAVSQGAPLRRMHIAGVLDLDGLYGGYASGGFIADSVIDGRVDNYSQQQWLTRNSSIGGWTNAVWNQVFCGDVGAGVPAQSFPNPAYTVLATTPVVREKPYLTISASGAYSVFVPALRRASANTSWSAGATPGVSVPISSFLIALPTTPLATINAALAAGKSLILTPGIYQFAGPIQVTHKNTIVLGLGYATLVPQNGTAALSVADVDGVKIAGLVIDAGPVNSPVLLEMGNPPGSGVANVANAHASDPSSVSDVFFRIGGATTGLATTSLQVDSAHVILDDVWAWRADHGNTPVGWTVNPAAHGLVVNGNDVTAIGLAVEHYQQNQVLWQGQGGTTIFYQSELPYDPPSQAAWMDGTTPGWASYTVASTVKSHTAYGLGVYSYFNQGVDIVDHSAISVPTRTGVSVTDAVSVFLGGLGSITHVVDQAGAGTTTSGVGSYLTSYP